MKSNDSRTTAIVGAIVLSAGLIVYAVIYGEGGFTRPTSICVAGRANGFEVKNYMSEALEAWSMCHGSQSERRPGDPAYCKKANKMERTISAASRCLTFASEAPGNSMEFAREAELDWALRSTDRYKDPNEGMFFPE